MTEKEPLLTEAYNAGDATPTLWAGACERWETARSYWLATARPDGRPHVVPLLAVWTDGALHFVASSTSRKSGNLARDPRCSITTSHDALDLVIEGTATKVTDQARLKHVAEVYATKYEWHVDIRDGAFYAEGAPTAGPPPYEVYEITQTIAFGFPWDETHTPTRWRF